MAQFTLPPNKTIPISLDAAKIQKVRSLHSIDLASDDGREFQKLAKDYCLLVGVIWTLTEPQATALGLTEQQFYEALVGDPLEHAVDALLQAILDFSPRRRRELIAAVVDKERALEKQAMERALAVINSKELETRLLTTLDDRINTALERALIPSSAATSSPDGLESRLMAGPSAN